MGGLRIYDRKQFLPRAAADVSALAGAVADSPKGYPPLDATEIYGQVDLENRRYWNGLAIILVPAWLTVLSPQFSNPPNLESSRVAWVLAKSFFLPLALGMLVRWRFPAVAQQVGDRLMAIAGLVLTVCALTLLILHWDVLLDAKWSGVLTLAGLIIVALAIGHLLGGPAEEDRTALAIACSTRHLGIAVLVAASLPGPRTAVIVAFYILTSAMISIPYLRWRRTVVFHPDQPGTSP
jgi:predicted Na+-dependent transporter